MNTFTKVKFYCALSALFVMLQAQVVFSQDQGKNEKKAPSFSFSGSVDLYYRMNFNTANNGDGGAAQAPTTSFANLSGFSLGMANVVAACEGDRSGIVADLVFGPRGAEAVFNSKPGQNIINQLYAYLNVSDNFTLTLGNFNTFLGYEVISPTGNFNYSTSYLFSYGPFSHAGFKADLNLGKVSFMLGMFNPTDATDFNPTGKYVGGAQLGFGGAYLNFLFDDDFFQVDFTGGWDLTDSFYMGINATTARDNFSGAAIYLQQAVTETFSLGIRGEYFQDEGVDALPTNKTDSEDNPDSAGESVVDLTLTGNIKIDNLTIIPEIRIDSYSEKDVIITDAKTGDAANSISSFVLAVVYAF